MVNPSSECPAHFSAVLFDEVLDLLIKTKKEQAKAMQQAKEELLSSWRKITKETIDKS